MSEVLGTTVPASLIDRLVEQAAGNALFLKELIRGVADGRGEAAPQTVLAMLQARLGRLASEARQVLLAASSLGRSFWLSAVQFLLGEQFPEPALQSWLQRLVELEWVEPQPSSRFPAQDEYRFRHALVRDAAYELVPDSHKPMGHRLAGLWLEQAGESDPQVLAEHARLGQQPERAIHFYIRAAEQLFERNDMPSTARCVETALALGAQGAELLRLRALQATTALWVGDTARLFATGPEVLAELKPGSLQWCWLVNGLHLGHLLSSRPEQAVRFGRLLLSTRPEPEVQPEASLGRTWSTSAQVCFSLFFEGKLWQSSAWLEQVSQEFFEAGPGTNQSRDADHQGPGVGGTGGQSQRRAPVT